MSRVADAASRLSGRWCVGVLTMMILGALTFLGPVAAHADSPSTFPGGGLPPRHADSPLPRTETVGPQDVVSLDQLPRHREHTDHGSKATPNSRRAIPTLAIACAAVLFFVGRWGYRNARNLVPTAYSKEGQARTARALKRGGALCQLVAGVLILAAIVTLVIRP